MNASQTERAMSRKVRIVAGFPLHDTFRNAPRLIYQGGAFGMQRRERVVRHAEGLQIGGLDFMERIEKSRPGHVEDERERRRGQSRLWDQ